MLASATPAPTPPFTRGKKPPVNRARHAQERFRNAIINNEGVPNYPRELQEALDQCTTKQRTLGLLLASGQSPVEAYRNAYDVKPGRESRSMAVDAHAASHHPNVSKVHSLAAAWLDTNWLLDATETVSWAVSNLYDIAEHAPKPADRLRATELLLRKHGELVDRKVVTHIDGTEADTQEALLKSILADVELIPALETSPAQLLTGPDVRPTSCPRCGGAMVDAPLMGDGDGI